jgi:hypothetical protein
MKWSTCERRWSLIKDFCLLVVSGVIAQVIATLIIQDKR